MTAHGIVRVTVYVADTATGTFYFDLGSSTHLGNYGGADHLFFIDAEGFLLEMDLEGAIPYVPPAG